VEDVAAVSKTGKRKWNISFSPLEVGKAWFYNEIVKLQISLIKTKGFDTYTYRKQRGFSKSKNKLDFKWEAHNSDSHSLAEMAIKTQIKPYYGLYQIEFLEYYRRQLHIQQPQKGNIRKQYGTTVSLKLSRGSVAKYKNKLVYIGGNSKGKIAIHNILTGKRIKQYTDIKEIQIMHITKQRSQFLPRLKSWVSLRDFS